MVEVLIYIASMLDTLAAVELPVSYGDACWIALGGIVGMIVIG